MPKAAPRSKPRIELKKSSALAAHTKKKAVPVVPVALGLVNFSFQNVAYQIDLDKSKVYRRFIEVEKSKQGSIITAYKTVRPRAAL